MAVAAIEGIRKRVKLDGIYVLVAAAAISIAATFLAQMPTTIHSAYEAALIALMSWVIAIGGDAWVAKIATKSKSVVAIDSWREEKTKNDREAKR